MSEQISAVEKPRATSSTTAAAAAVSQPKEFTLCVFARWHDRSAWQRIVDAAPKKSDDASLASWWSASANLHYELPLFIEARAKDDAERDPILFSSRTDVMRGLEAPINRPRCELQAACRALQAVLRYGGSDKSKTWRKIEINVGDSLYLAANATRPRLHTWYKNGYKEIANRPLWENIRLGLDRLHEGGIECRFVSSLPITAKPFNIELRDLFSEQDQTKKRKQED